MRIKIALISKDNNNIMIPTGYNHLLQSMIYHNLTFPLNDFLHNKAYSYGNHIFKLFTFSQFMEKAKFKKIKNKKFFIFPEKITFFLSSPFDDILLDFIKNISKDKRVRIGSQILYVNSIQVVFPPVLKEKLLISTLSPITVHSTLLLDNNSKYTYYYAPDEKAFADLILENLIKKFKLISNEEISPDDTFFSITPVTIKQEILFYKKFIVKGWSGKFEITGSIKLLGTAYESGLGVRNSAGFGMFNIVNP